MARQLICGFEAGWVGGIVAAGVGEVGAGPASPAGTIQSLIKRSGNYALRITNEAGSVRLNQTQTAANWIVAPLTANALFTRGYIYVIEAPGSYAKILTYSNEITAQIIASGAGFTLRVANSGTAQTFDYSTVLSLNTWYMIESAVNNTANTARVKVDGTERINADSTLTTDPTGIEIGLGATSNYDVCFDDFSIDNAAYPGAGAIVSLYPNAVGNAQAFTPLSGTDHAAMVDDYNAQVSDDADTSYLSAATSGTISETNGVLNFTGNFTASSIVCVLPVVIVRNSSGSANVGTARLRSGSTNSDATATDPGATFVTRARLFETDPADAAAWTSAKLDALEVGYVKTQSQARAVRFTASHIMVEYAQLQQASLAPVRSLQHLQHLLVR